MKNKDKTLFNFIMIVAIIGNLGLTIKDIYQKHPMYIPLNILGFVGLIIYQKKVNDMYYK